jgi:RHS repeat-associated protein
MTIDKIEIDSSKNAIKHAAGTQPAWKHTCVSGMFCFVFNCTSYYSGTCEKEITGSTAKEYDYIYSPEGLAAIVVKNGGTYTKYYAHTDNLGSLRVLTDANKNITARYRYDAWGKRTLVVGDNTITKRGFTMHEHLDAFGLINMNARMYDPALGRFLSPDPYVQMPDNTQSYNRYLYAHNNPLIYTDPSGEFIFTALLSVMQTVSEYSLSV